MFHMPDKYGVGVVNYYECISYAIKDGWLVLDGARLSDDDPNDGTFTVMWPLHAVDYVVVVPD